MDVRTCVVHMTFKHVTCGHVTCGHVNTCRYMCCTCVNINFVCMYGQLLRTYMYVHWDEVEESHCVVCMFIGMKWRRAIVLYVCSLG